MNLTTDRWIPVIWNDGTPDKVSLTDAFQQGDRIRDLSVRPHERIAVMRLLICIAQAALDGPKDRDEWRTCEPRLADSATAYLSSWSHAFELFGDGQRFLQVPHVVRASEPRGRDDEDNSASKLDFCLATGNNSTLFDNAGGSERAFSADTLALMFLTFQCFSPGGLIGNANWNGVPMGRSSNHAPCVVKSMLHGYVLRNCLAGTLHANLLTQEGIAMLRRPWGRPVWEAMPTGPQPSEAVANATDSYLGRLVPMSRTARLSPDGRSLVLSEGMRYNPEWREVAATVVIRNRNGSPERTLLNASLTKSVWREAHAIAVSSTSANALMGGPLALVSSSRHEPTDLWCGALVVNKSKLLDTLESVLHFPAAMFGDAGQRLYAHGVQFAELWGRKVERSVSTYRRELNDELDRAEGRKRGDLVKRKAASQYWTAVEQQVARLLAVIDTPSVLRADASGKPHWSKTAWGEALARAAVDAYNVACPHGTPRQLKAYSRGLGVLFTGAAISEEPRHEENEA